MRLSHHIGIKRDKKVRVYTSYLQEPGNPASGLGEIGKV